MQIDGVNAITAAPFTPSPKDVAGDMPQSGKMQNGALFYYSGAQQSQHVHHLLAAFVKSH